MSDSLERNNLEPMDGEVMPAEEAIPAVRHRRSGKPRQEAPEAPAEEAAAGKPVPAVGEDEAAAKPAAPSMEQTKVHSVTSAATQTVRISPKTPVSFGQGAGNSQNARPLNAARAAFHESASATPRPRALDRTEGTAAPRQGEVRRPVNAAGYSRQEPLGKVYDSTRRTPSSEPAQARDRERPRQADFEEEESGKQGVSRLLVIVLAVVLLLAVLVAGFLLIPEDAEGAFGDLKRTVSGTVSRLTGAEPTKTPDAVSVQHARDFYAEYSSNYAPCEVMFYLTTDRDVSDVQLLDAEGAKLEGIVYHDETPEGEIEWGIQVTFDNPYWGTIRPQVMTDAWEDTGLTQQISVIEETIRETSTIAPTLQVVNDILDFSASPAQGTAPVNIAFSMTTSLSITQVRLVDDNGDPLEAEASVLVDNASTRIWALNHTFDHAYSGVVRAQANIDGTWLDSNKLVSLSVQGAAATSTPFAFTMAPSEDTPLPAVTQMPEPDVIPADEGDASGEAWEEMPTDDLAALDDVPADEWESVEWSDETIDTVDTDAVDPALAAVATQAPLVNGTLPEPTPEATQEPAAEERTEPAQDQAAEAESTEEGESAERLTVKADASADPALIKNSVIYNGTKKVEVYERPAVDLISMPDADGYARQPYGVMTFRGSSFRQNAAEGTVNDPTEMEVLWKQEVGSAKSNGKTVYYGVNWTGQPVIIKWSKEVREMSNIYEEKKATKALREVIVAADDGRIYFLDLETGEKTRASLETGVPMRGTPSVHALGFPVLSVGQYARKMAKKTYDIGMRVYNLLNSKQLFMIDGLDGKLDRPYYDVGSFETSSLFDYNSDSMLTIGTNGMLYLTKLNTTIDRTSGTLTVNPSHVSVKTRASGESEKQVAVESSMAAYQNYVFYADMGGILRCVDTSSLKTLWAVKTDDAVEAAVALDLVDDGQTLWLYTANTLQNRKSGACQIRRYDALTGRLDWTYEVPVKKNTKSGIIAGAKASPVVGRNGLSGLVYFTVNLATDVDGSAAEGVLIALDKETGKMVWRRPLTSYAYSSPVAVYNANGRGWIVQAAANGTIELLDGMSGAVTGQLKIDGTVLASPAVYKDIMVIATTGKNTSNIYGIALK